MPYERTTAAHPYWLSTLQEFLLPDLPLALVSEEVKPHVVAAFEAIRSGKIETAVPHIEATLSLLQPATPGAGFAHAARGLCFLRSGLSAEAVTSLTQARTCLPHDPRIVYSLGLCLLKTGAVADAVASFREAVAMAPELAPAWAALALIFCLEHDHPATETAAREALRLAYPLPGRLVDLALMQATLHQGKPAEGAFDFSTLSLEHGEVDLLLHRLLATMPPVDPASLVHPDHGRPVYFAYADHLYCLEHVIPLVLSLKETNARCAIHLHIANPGRSLDRELEKLRGCLGDIPLVVSTESVFVEQFAAPPIYHSCVRFVRLWQIFMANRLPMVALDADCLARRDPAVLLEQVDPVTDVVLARSDVDPYWSRFYGGYVAIQPSTGAAAFLGRVATFILDNFAKGTARWFLDQTALTACHDHLQPGVRFTYFPWSEMFGGLAFSETQVFWTAHNDDKYGDNPHTRLKDALRSRHGFPRRINDEPYEPVIIGNAQNRLVINKHDTRIATEVTRSGAWRKREVDLLASVSRPGHTVVDAGARFGAATVHLARVVGPHGKVHCFEPDRLEFQLLVANLALAAATSAFPHLGNLRVDDLSLDACHLIRIGESFDRGATLSGAAKTIARHLPVVYIADAGGLPHNALNPLRELGYTMYLHGVDESCGGVLGLPPGSRLNVNGMQRLEL